VQVHVAAALTAVAIGPVAIFRTRRDRLHKVLGYTWIAAMSVTALSAFWILEIRVIGPWSPIHLLAAWTLLNLGIGLRQAIRRDIARHRATMRGLYFQGIGLAGFFTLLPGRRMNAVLFGDDGTLGFGLSLALAAVVAAVLWSRRRGAAAA
jgi:uncharacterized membrane protein